MEIYINPSDKLLFSLVNRCQFAYKSDGKGFAFNSSALINLLNLGCILITKSTKFTPKFLLDKYSKYCGAILFQEFPTHNILSNRLPQPEYVYKIITTLSYEIKKKIIEKSKLLLNDFFNPSNIINKFYKDVQNI